ncbi:vitellogenin receptor-like [Mya arenaria]|uniref:vitellogenin receptor-like n=1 Tax=Mya arenaria TaxID=6604 RepID=UPI0022E532AC|nr:vitellogenin receptor-like [Mya arenaria]
MSSACYCFLWIVLFLVFGAPSGLPIPGGNGTCMANLRTLEMTKHCSKEEHVESAVAITLSKHQFKVISACLNCSFTMVTRADHVLVATLYSLGTETGSDGKCDKNRLDVYNGRKVNDSRILSGKTGICGCKFPAKSEFQSTENALTVRLFTPCNNRSTHGELVLVVSSIPNELYNRTECPGQFKCLSGECIDKNLVCDGTPACKDKSDETNCTGARNHTCAGKFECGNGKCIDKNLVCNGKNDCTDKSDEKGCHGNKHTLMFVLIGIAGLAVIVLVIILIVLCCRYCCHGYASAYRRLA